MPDLRSIVAHCRTMEIRGRSVDLIPCTAGHAAEVVRLRNLPEARYHLSQDFESTLESQLDWHAGYLERNDDIFWLLRDKSGRIIGCNRLYAITPGHAEKGSQIVEARHARAAPVALEGDLLAIRLAFDVLGVAAVLARVRHDNDKVISMNRRLGFADAGVDRVRGVPYVVLRLERDEFHPQPFDQLIDHWRRRHERSPA